MCKWPYIFVNTVNTKYNECFSTSNRVLWHTSINIIFSWFQILVPELKAFYHVMVLDIKEGLERVGWRPKKKNPLYKELVSVELLVVKTSLLSSFSGLKDVSCCLKSRNLDLNTSVKVFCFIQKYRFICHLKLENVLYYVLTWACFKEN